MRHVQYTLVYNARFDDLDPPNLYGRCRTVRIHVLLMATVEQDHASCISCSSGHAHSTERCAVAVCIARYYKQHDSIISSPFNTRTYAAAHTLTELFHRRHLILQCSLFESH